MTDLSEAKHVARAPRKSTRKNRSETGTTIDAAKARVEAYQDAYDLGLELAGRVRDLKRAKDDSDMIACVNEIAEVMSGKRGPEAIEAVKAALIEDTEAGTAGFPNLDDVKDKIEYAALNARLTVDAIRPLHEDPEEYEIAAAIALAEKTRAQLKELLAVFYPGSAD